jgi:hypothetical protein
MLVDRPRDLGEQVCGVQVVQLGRGVDRGPCRRAVGREPVGDSGDRVQVCDGVERIFVE